MYLNRFRLADETAVVTGGGRGFGPACAKALAEAGARVILVERDEGSAPRARPRSPPGATWPSS